MNLPPEIGHAVRVHGAIYVSVPRLMEFAGATMFFAWLLAIGIIVGGVLLMTHLGVNVLGLIGQGFHELEHALATPL